MNFETKTTYSFTVYGAGLLGTDFSRATVLAIMDTNTARMIGHDVDATHALIRSSLPQNAVANLEDYTFLLVELPTKQKTVVAVEWIDQSTIQVVRGIAARITTDRGLTNDDVERIRVFFASVGIAANIELI